MNKKLLALAIGAAAALPLVAQADGPTLYGKINVSLENQDDGTDDVWKVVSNASRLGVKGDAETGVDGLKGVYVAEYEIAADDGDAVFKQRNIYAGLKGGFGTVLAGMTDTPLKTVQGKVDQFNDTTYDMKAAVNGELRAPNVVAYASPKIADAVTITVAAWQGEGDTGPDGEDLVGLGDAISASVVYDVDGLYLGLAIDQGTPSEEKGVDLAASGDVYNDITRLVAGYTTDAFEVGFLYQTAEGIDEPATDAKDTAMLLSGAYKTGDWKFKAQYVTAEGDQVDDTLTMLALGADYKLGKATTLGGFYGTQEMDNAADEDTTLAFYLEQKW